MHLLRLIRPGLVAGASIARRRACLTTASATVATAAATAATPVSPKASLSKEMGAHTFVVDPRNADVKFYVNGDIVPKAEASVNVLDSGFMMGDGVWEGVRLHEGHFAYLDQHLTRLYEGAKQMDINIPLTPEEFTAELHRLVIANKMENASGVHARIMVTRGLKYTPYQSPKVNVGPPTIVITIEYKSAANETVLGRGLKLATTNIRRGAPDVQDQKLNSHSKINCISACIQAQKAGADEALMLDPLGFVATCNSTHFFIVRNGEIWTSRGGYCIPGITRGNLMRLAREDGIPVLEKDFSLYEVYSADEAFVTGTFGGLTAVAEVDGRLLGYKYAKPRPDVPLPDMPGPMVKRLRQLYLADIKKHLAPWPEQH